MSVKIAWDQEIREVAEASRRPPVRIVEVWCPHCGSDRIDEQGVVTMMYSVSMWEWDDELLTGPAAVPHDYGHSEVVNGSEQDLLDDEEELIPYYCHNCWTDLRREHLVVTDPENDNRRVE